MVKICSERKNWPVNTLADYGIYAQASRARGLISREMRKCSGSRTGSSCSKVSSSGWQCGLASADEVPASKCLTLGMVGLPGLAGLQPADMRKAHRRVLLVYKMNTIPDGSNWVSWK